MPNLTKEVLDELERILEALPPGEWEALHDADAGNYVVLSQNGLIVCTEEDDEPGKAIAAFIAAARNHFGELLRIARATDECDVKYVASLEAEVAVLRKRLAELLKYARHKKDCRINPGGPIMAALGDPEVRPCSCGLAELENKDA